MAHRPADLDELAFLASYDASAYPHPSVAVDVVLLDGRAADRSGPCSSGARTSRSSGAGRYRAGSWAWTSRSTTRPQRVLATKAGLEDVFTEQLYTFGDPGRDPRTRVISVVYYALVDADRLERAVAARGTASGLALADVAVPRTATSAREEAHLEVREAGGTPFPSPSTTTRVLATAVERIRGKLDYAPIGFELLPETFTLRDLRLVHEAILGHPLNKDSFRRKVLDRGLVVATGERLAGVGHRPPELYRFVRPGAEPPR